MHHQPTDHLRTPAGRWPRVGLLLLAAGLLSVACTISASQNPPNDSPGDENPEPTDKSLRPLELLYFNDFETEVGPEWDNIRRDAAPTFVRAYLGQYRNDTTTLTLHDLPPHTHVEISFDVYVIGSWDGNSTDAGPDIWSLSCDGRTVFETTFAYFQNVTQAFPNVYPIGNNRAQSGAIEVGSLGYSFFEANQIIEWNAVYNMSFSVPHTASSVAFQFAARNLEENGSETWGIDNVTVRVTPAPEWKTALVIEAEDFAVRPSGGPIENGWLLWQTARITDWVDIKPETPELRINAVVRGDPAKGRWPIMGVTLNQRFLSGTTIAQSGWTMHTLPVSVEPGIQQIGLAFTNDEPPVAGQDRNLYIDRLEIQVPPDTPESAYPVRVTPPDYMAEPVIPETDAEIIALANANIEQYRKSDFHVALVTPQGQPIAGESARFRMFRHAFKWGSAVRFDLNRPNTPIEQKYRKQAGILFNYATTEDLVRWGAFEPQRGQRRFDDLNTYLDICAQLGMDLKAHNIIWGNFEDLPRWLTDDDIADATGLLEDRTRDLVARNAGRIASYDVVNEPMHALQWEFWAGPNYLADAIKWAYESDPSAQLLINEYELVGVPDMCDNFYVRMRDTLARGAPVSGIGIQLHANLGEWYTAREIWRAFERLKALGIPLQMTEISLGQRDATVVGGPYTGQPWTDALQAEYYEQVMRVSFGHPDVEAVTFWGFTDRKHFQPGSGMLDFNLQDKLSGARYRELLNKEWSTDVRLTTGGAGQAAFRGFHGWYRVESDERIGVAYLAPGSVGTPNAPITVVMFDLGDGNGDGTVDATDYAAFDACYTRSLNGPVLADCVPYDIDGDFDVDCDDWAVFKTLAVLPLPDLPPCSLPVPTVTAHGSRYISIAVPPGSQPVALRVTSDSWLCVAKYVDANGLLVDEPVYRLPAEWGTIDVGSPFIVPDSSYTVELFTGAHLSPGASARTWLWGDTNNDGLVNGDDLVPVVDAYHGQYGLVDYRAVDMAGCVPNRGVDVDDVQAITGAINGISYYATCPEPCDAQGNAWEP